MHLPYHAVIYSISSFNLSSTAKSNHTIFFQNKLNDHQLMPRELGAGKCRQGLAKATYLMMRALAHGEAALLLL